VKVVLHDRTNGLGQEVRDTAQRKLDRLARHFGKVVDAEVEFLEERKQSDLTTFVCRIVVHLDGRRAPVLYAHERGADPQSALDLALDKIDRQVIAFKEKVTHRRQAVSAVRVLYPTQPNSITMRSPACAATDVSVGLTAPAGPFPTALPLAAHSLPEVDASSYAVGDPSSVPTSVSGSRST